MDGLELTRRLRAMPDYKFVPIVLLTTESHPEKKQEGKAAGATGWIVKPFNPDQLLAVVKEGDALMSIDIMEQMRDTFRAEALDLLIELDSALLSLEAEPGDSSLVHRVFRAIHTIKGSGATAGFAHLARFAHKMEEAFDLAREGRLAVTPDLIDCGLKACDVIRLIIEEKAEGAVPGEVEVAAAFTRLLPAPEIPLEAPCRESPEPLEVRAAFEIVFKPNREMFYSGADPVTLLDELRELGQAHITAHADQVPPLPSLEAEHCYLWWEILLVTDRDEAAIKDVFVFVEDECELRIRLLEDQTSAVALLGSVPAEAFELFVVECEDHLEGIETDALALESDPSARDNLDSLFRSVHSIKGNAGLLLADVKGAAIVASHPLQLLLRVAHGLESLLDPFRGVTAGPLPDETIQTALETCDAIRTLLGSLTHNGAGGPVSPELLGRLGVRDHVAPSCQDSGWAGSRISQHDVAVRRDDRGLFPAHGKRQRVHGTRRCKPICAVSRPCRRPCSTGTARNWKNRWRNNSASWMPPCGPAQHWAVKIVPSWAAPFRQLAPFWTACRQTAISRRCSRACRLPCPTPAKAPADRPDAGASPSTIRIEQNKLDRLMRVVGELLVARGAFPLLVQKLNDGADGAGVVKDLKEAGSNISRIADELQTSVMSIRMLPVKTVFQRFPRLVRDLARSLGKEVRLVIEGEGIELDKTILEQIGDPLVHVIRNAVDHGLETSGGAPGKRQGSVRTTDPASAP